MALQSSNVLELAQRGGSFQDAINEKIGKAVAKSKVLGELVMVATYVPPEKTKGGIFIPNKSLDENRFQGKVGMVLKLGESAFKYTGPYDHEGSYRGTKPKVGDYVVYRASDGMEMFINGTSVRLIDSHLIKMVVDDPEAFY